MTISFSEIDYPLRLRSKISPPKQWQTVRLAEVAEARLGKMLDAQKNRGQPHPYLRNPNVRWFDVDLADLQQMLFEDGEEEKFSVRDGDVLICEGGEAGRAAIWNGPDIGVKFQKAIHRVRPDPNLFNRFLVHRLFYDYHNGGLIDYYTGTTINHFTGQDLARYEFALPSIDEQRRLAAILDQADDLRRKRREVLQSLDSPPSRIFRTAFGRMNESSDLGKVTTQIYRYPTYYDISYVDYGVPEIRGEMLLPDGNISDDPELIRYISDATSRKFPNTIVETGDLVMTVRGTIGKLGLVPPSLNGANITANLIRIAPDRKKVDPVFLWHALQSRGARIALTRASSSTTIATIKASDLKALLVPYPDLEEQRAFANRIAELDKLRAAGRAHLAKLDALFASLQHRAFRGEL